MNTFTKTCIEEFHKGKTLESLTKELNNAFNIYKNTQFLASLNTNDLEEIIKILSKDKDKNSLQNYFNSL